MKKNIFVTFFLSSILMLLGCKSDLFDFNNEYIAQEDAIDRAISLCSIMHMEQKETPYNIEADLMTLGEAFGYSTSSFWRFEQPPSTVVWVISMDGYWLIHGPPSAEGEDYPPGSQSHCMIIMEALTGGMIMQSSQRFRSHTATAMPRPSSETKADKEEKQTIEETPYP